MSSSSTAQVILPPLISSRWRVKSRDQSLLDSHVTYQLKKKKKTLMDGDLRTLIEIILMIFSKFKQNCVSL